MNMEDNRRSIRDYGYIIGEGCPGPLNRITDVPGVRVGHATVDTDRNQTGVTVIIPCEGCVYQRKPVAAVYTMNGYGKTAGSIQIEELGTIETPIALTNTLNVGRVSDALVEYTLRQCREAGITAESINPVVGETNDHRINHIEDRAAGQNEVFSAIENACRDFTQGSVGAGRGTVCFGLKGGIGSSSRLFRFGGRTYTIGALVQSNFGGLRDLTVCGRPVGQKIFEQMNAQAASVHNDEGQPELRQITSAQDVTGDDEACQAKSAQIVAGHTDSCQIAKDSECISSERASLDQGSIMVVIGTDIPLSSRQLKRVLKRAVAGLVRTGSHLGHGSGDIFLGFTNGNFMPEAEEEKLLTVQCLPEERLDGVFRLCEEAVEEAILNSLTYADSAVMTDGSVCHCLREYL